MGFDFDLENEKWTTEHKKPRVHYDRILEEFNQWNQGWERLGLKVYNTNPQSMIKCFEYKEIPSYV